QEFGDLGDRDRRPGAGRVGAGRVGVHEASWVSSARTGRVITSAIGGAIGGAIGSANRDWGPCRCAAAPPSPVGRVAGRASVPAARTALLVREGGAPG